MITRTCRACGFTILGDEGMPGEDWLCQVCEAKGSPPSPEPTPAPAEIPRTPERASPPFECPSCHGVFRISDPRVGRRLVCPHCKGLLRVSADGTLQQEDPARERHRRYEVNRRRPGAGIQHRPELVRHGEEEADEPMPEPSPLLLYSLITLPFLTGLLPVYLPGLLRPARRIVLELLRLLT